MWTLLQKTLENWLEATDSNQLISIYYPRYDPVEGHKRFTVVIVLYSSLICPFWRRMNASKDNNHLEFITCKNDDFVTFVHSIYSDFVIAYWL